MSTDISAIHFEIATLGERHNVWKHLNKAYGIMYENWKRTILRSIQLINNYVLVMYTFAAEELYYHLFQILCWCQNFSRDWLVNKMLWSVDSTTTINMVIRLIYYDRVWALQFLRRLYYFTSVFFKKQNFQSMEMILWHKVLNSVKYLWRSLVKVMEIVLKTW